MLFVLNFTTAFSDYNKRRGNSWLLVLISDYIVGKLGAVSQRGGRECKVSFWALNQDAFWQL